MCTPTVHIHLLYLPIYNMYIRHYDVGLMKEKKSDDENGTYREALVTG